MKLFVAFLACLPAFAAWPNGYTQRYTITVGAAQVPSSQTGFTQPITGTYSWMADTGHGGQVTHTASTTCSTETITCPMDLIFTSDANGSTLLKWEIEKYDNTTGAIVAWVGWGANSISNGAKIYAFAGNSGVSTWQGGLIGSAWDSNTQMLYHMPPGSGTPSAKDSMGLHNGSMVGSPTVPTGVAGELDGAGSFVTSGSLDTGANSFSTGFRRSGTIQCWVNVQGADTGAGFPCISDFDGTNGINVRVDHGSTTATCYLFPGNYRATTTFTFTGSTWYMLTCVYDGVGAHVYMYVNGSTVNSAALSGDVVSSTAHLKVNLAFGQQGDANYDEVRFTTSVWSANRIQTEYNAQSAPSTFAAITGPDAPPSSGARRRLIQ